MFDMQIIISVNMSFCIKSMEKSNRWNVQLAPAMKTAWSSHWVLFWKIGVLKFPVKIHEKNLWSSILEKVAGSHHYFQEHLFSRKPQVTTSVKFEWVQCKKNKLYWVVLQYDVALHPSLIVHLMCSYLDSFLSQKSSTNRNN